MWLEANNLHARVVRATREDRRWLHGYLSFEDTSAHYRKGGGGGRTSLYNLIADSFPAGLISLVIRGAKAEGFQVQIIDKRTCPAPRDPNADLAWLRDYQKEAVEVSARRTRGILWHVTGAGKGEVALGLVRAMPCRWLFIVHRSGLMYDIADRYEKRNSLEAAGRIGDGKWELADPSGASGASLTCATFQTLSKAYGTPRFAQLADSAQGLIVDECHCLPSASFWRVAMQMRNAYYRIGLSGTPLARGDQRSLYAVAALGSVIHRIKPDVLIAAGVLAKPRIKLIPCFQTSDRPTWQGVYGECIVRSKRRNRIVIEAAKRAKTPMLVFVKEIKHGKLLRTMLEDADIQTDFVWGSDSQQSRERSVERLERGDIEAIVCSVVFQEGIDIPSLESVVVASGGQSVIATLQRIGRGMRTDQGRKATFEVWDFDDRGQKWLEKHSRARSRAYRSENYEVVVESVTA